MHMYSCWRFSHWSFSKMARIQQNSADVECDIWVKYNFCASFSNLFIPISMYFTSTIIISHSNIQILVCLLFLIMPICDWQLPLPYPTTFLIPSVPEFLRPRCIEFLINCGRIVSKLRNLIKQIRLVFILEKEKNIFNLCWKYCNKASVPSWFIEPSGLNPHLIVISIFDDGGERLSVFAGFFLPVGVAPTPLDLFYFE
jgi:hypothetical protein